MHMPLPVKWYIMHSAACYICYRVDDAKTFFFFLVWLPVVRVCVCGRPVQNAEMEKTVKEGLKNRVSARVHIRVPLIHTCMSLITNLPHLPSLPFYSAK